MYTFPAAPGLASRAAPVILDGLLSARDERGEHEDIRPAMNRRETSSLDLFLIRTSIHAKVDFFGAIKGYTLAFCGGNMSFT